MTYQRNGRLLGTEPQEEGVRVPPKADEPKGVRLDGFQQVIEMLKIADPEFRASLMKRLTAHDPTLAKAIQRRLNLSNS